MTKQQPPALPSTEETTVSAPIGPDGFTRLTGETPAAPEGDVRLTEAECNRLTNFLDFYSRGAESISGLVEEVAGIIAERLRVVEGERDRWEHIVTQVEGERDMNARVEVAWREAAAEWEARAESAEAAHEALREGIEALADEWEHPAEVYALRKSAAPRLRALLAGGAS